MKPKTFIDFLGKGRFWVILLSAKAITPYYRVVWLAAAVSSGLLRSLEGTARSLDELAAEMAPDPNHRDSLEAWLRLGVRLGDLKLNEAGYSLRSFLAKKLSRVEMDPFAAFIEEVASLHGKLILETPARLREGKLWSLADQDGELIARSSQMLEPLGFEAMDYVLDGSKPQHLLEVGSGSGTYLRYAAGKNPALTAVGLELQADVAELANRNLEAWGVSDRARVEFCDVRNREPEPSFDIATLLNNIYYFEVGERVTLFRHLRSFLKPGGELLLITGCRNGSPAMQALDLWCASTEGCGRLPTPRELEAQLMEAGFTRVDSKNLVPGESICALVAAS